MVYSKWLFKRKKNVTEIKKKGIDTGNTRE